MKHLAFAACLVSSFFLFSSNVHAENLFKCQSKAGHYTYSDKPCSIHYHQIEIKGGNVVTLKDVNRKHKKFIKTTQQKLLTTSRWVKDGFIFTLKNNGTFHTEKRVNNRVIAWQSGKWNVKHARLELLFTQHSQNLNKHMKNKDRLLAGVIRWDKDKENFSMRAAGIMRYFKKYDPVEYAQASAVAEKERIAKAKEEKAKQEKKQAEAKAKPAVASRS